MTAGKVADGGRPTSIVGSELRRLTVGVVATVAFIAFEAMAVATAMPRAVQDLDGLPMYAWAFSGFFTASMFAMVLSGELCDRRGPRFPLVAGTVAFTVGLLVAGSAQSMWPFVAGRAAQGLGAGLVIVALYVLIARAYSEDLRPRVFALTASAWVVPAIVGPLVAGTLADHVSWRLVFIGVVPLVAMAVLLALPQVSAYDGPPPNGPTLRRGRLRLATATAAAMGALQFAGLRRDVVALVVAVAAVVVLARSLPGLLPAGTFRLRRGLPTVVAMRGILAGSFFGAEAFLPLMLVDQRGLSATLAGLALTGGALGWAAGAWYQSRPTLAVPRYMLLRLGSGAVAGGIGLAGLVLLPSVPAFVAAAAWTFGAIGMGMSFASISVLLFQLSPVEDHGANSAALQLNDAAFSIVFVGLAGVIFGSVHEAAGDTHPAAYAGILAVMVALASVGSWAAGRVRPEVGVGR